MKPGSELTVEQVSLIFKKIGPLDVVRLSGGEPFLRQDFLELAQAVDNASQPSVLHITTNGSFPDRILDFASQFPRKKNLRFMISFDGLEAEHDANRGKDVTFDLAEKSVRWLAKLKHTGLAVSINHTVISEESMKNHEALCERFEPLGVDVHVVLAYSDSAMYGAKRFGTQANDLITNGYPLHPKLKDADTIGFVKMLMENLPRLKDRNLRWGKRYYLQGLLARLEGQEHPMPHPGCVALRSHIRLLPDGSVPVCQFNTEKIGNLATHSFEEVWSNAKTSEARDWVDNCKGCWAECEVMPSAIYTGDLFGFKR